MKPFRCWINQPSTLQPLHHMHGVRGLCVSVYSPGTVTFYPFEGSVASMVVPSICLSRTEN